MALSMNCIFLAQMRIEAKTFHRLEKNGLSIVPSSSKSVSSSSTESFGQRIPSESFNYVIMKSDEGNIRVDDLAT